MIRKELLDAIADLNFWYKEQDTGIEREELETVLKLVGAQDTVLSITGLRRVGKTYLSKQILAERIRKGLDKKETLYVNFEEPYFEPLLNVSLLDNLYDSYRHFISKGKTAVVVLDEVHNIAGWEKWVRMKLERKENAEIILTGSSSKFSKPQLAQVLTGRIIDYNLWPLSFSSFLKFRRIEEDYLREKDILPLLYEYLEYGALPIVVLFENNEQKKYFLKDIYEAILTKDVILKNKLKDEHRLKGIATILLHNFSKYVSVRKLRNFAVTLTGMTLSPTTINNYLHFLEDSFLFYLVPIFSYKVKDQMQYPRKVYSIDTGIITAVTKRFSEDLGRFYENIVAVELVRRYGKDNLFYWKSPEGYEVDFVVKGGLEVQQLIQVCWNPQEKETRERELRSLLKAMEEFDLKTGLIITESYESLEKQGNGRVCFQPLWKWLLDKE